MNISVPIVASTERCDSGSKADVQGPPEFRDQFDVTRKFPGIRRAALTSSNDEISRVAQTIARSDSVHSLARARSLDDQILNFTLRPSQNELDSGLHAQMPSPHAGL